MVLDESEGTAFSFALDDDSSHGSIVLRTARSTGRRFDLARLLGDRLATGAGTLFPATTAYTYRQQWQRAFAAELLCPFDVLERTLAGDLSERAIEGAADHFRVSEWLIRTILQNHDLVDGDGRLAIASVA